ncbi:uncharacterized protein LOC119615435 [Lucilia sericata]|uniref:uncharacterized protein LOC119615435 n=1 Tax=Lucilia sericata TaxID=13632 RepID=UPI0018A7EFD1|nr:uncharacterized protein LOC119615435 [Lucilia sericata]
MSSNLEVYIGKYLIPEIVAQLDNEELISYKAKSTGGLDSFMSSLYDIKLKTKTREGIKERLLFAKFMRGDVSFRETSKSYTQFSNEIYAYGKVLPAYDKLLKDLNVNSLNVKDLVAPIYIAKFGYIEGLSSAPNVREAALVMENLKSLGYQLGPRLVLKTEHLLNMSKRLGQLHALSYALKAVEPKQFETLKSGIIDFPFINENDPNDIKNNSYRILHRHAFDRLYDFVERKLNTETFNKKCSKDLKLIECLEKLKAKYFDLPTRLPEKLRTKVNNTEEDRYFATILHGDYNRNNVLFKYKAEEVTMYKDNFVKDVKLIDFQQLRFDSPALDLSFFMYFNTAEEERYAIWEDLLKTYHNTMFSTLSTTLKASQKSVEDISKILQNYTFAKFLAHFARFAFYGVVICLHFLHWMFCSPQECTRISELWTTDIHGEEFRKLSLEAGGDEVNMKFLSILRHACEMGYMDDL